MRPDVILNIKLKNHIIETIEGDNVVAKDLLVRNFWRFFIGFLTDADVTVTTTDDRVAPMRSGSGEHTRAPASLRFGTSNISPDWGQIRIISGLGTGEGPTIPTIMYTVGNNMIIEFARVVTSSSIREAAIYYDTWCFYFHAGMDRWWEHTIMLARAVLTSPPPVDSVVRYRIIFRPPFVANLCRIWHGLLRDTIASGVVDADGTMYSAKTDSDANTGLPILGVGVGDKPFDINDYCLTTPLYLSTTHRIVHESAYSLLAMIGLGRLEADMNIREIGIFQTVHDVGFQGRRTLIMRYVLPTPIRKKAGDVLYINVNIYASS